jgi:hypothetical protein
MKDTDKQVDRMVKDWYASKANNEWLRLQQILYHRIEFMTTMHFLEKTCQSAVYSWTQAGDRADILSN